MYTRPMLLIKLQRWHISSSTSGTCTATLHICIKRIKLLKTHGGLTVVLPQVDKASCFGHSGHQMLIVN